MNNADIYALTHLLVRGWKGRDPKAPQTDDSRAAWSAMREVIEGMGFIGHDALEAGEWVPAAVQDQQIRDHMFLEKEVERLKDIIRADRQPGDAKTIRVEVMTNAEKNGWAMVVTDPIGDEEKLAHTIAGLFNLLVCTVTALAEKRVADETPDR